MMHCAVVLTKEALPQRNLWARWVNRTESQPSESEDESESQPSEAEAKTKAEESQSRDQSQDQDQPWVLQHWCTVEPRYKEVGYNKILV